MSIIIWNCETCDLPILGGAGYFYIDHSDVARYEEADRAWEASVTDQPAVTLGKLLESPPQARWHFHHDECRPDPDDYGYYVGIEKVGTFRQMLAWTAHLMGKSWFHSTDWDEVIDRALSNNPAPNPEEGQ